MNCVFFIGAGASRGDNERSPLDNDFLSFMADKTVLGTPTVLEYSKPSGQAGDFREASTFLDEYFSFKLFTDRQSLSMEQVLSCARIKDPLAYNQLINLIGRYFSLLHNPSPPVQNSYVRLLQYTRARNLNGMRTSILSFNWDGFLEIAFIRDTLKYRIGQTPNIQGSESTINPEEWKDMGFFDFPMGVPPDPLPAPVNDFYREYDQMYSYWAQFYTPPLRHRFGEFGKYVKLHGSFEMVICRRCEKIWRSHRAGFYDQSSIATCPKCQTEAERLIIPPIPRKEISSQLLLSQWVYAQQAVPQADEIVAWGYSFPPTDIRAHRLLDNLKSTAKIVLVNPYPCELYSRLSQITDCPITAVPTLKCYLECAKGVTY